MAAGDATIIGLEELKTQNQNQDLDQDQDQDLDQDQTLVFEISNQESLFSEQYASDSTDRYDFITFIKLIFHTHAEISAWPWSEPDLAESDPGRKTQSGPNSIWNA